MNTRPTVRRSKPIKRRKRGLLAYTPKPEGVDEAYWSCGRKQRFKKMVNAERHLKRIAKKGIIMSDNANAYACKFCSGFHVGHKPREMRDV